jgi:hypothetical protein
VTGRSAGEWDRYRGWFSCLVRAQWRTKWSNAEARGFLIRWRRIPAIQSAPLAVLILFHHVRPSLSVPRSLLCRILALAEKREATPASRATRFQKFIQDVFAHSPRYFFFSVPIPCLRPSFNALDAFHSGSKFKRPLLRFRVSAQARLSRVHNAIRVYRVSLRHICSVRQMRS